ncbi:MAG: hypothetical protein RL662_1506 [Bacteroidota bacterium]
MSDKTKNKEELRSELEENDLSKRSLREKFIILKRILERCCKDLTQNESLQFPSLFSRLVFIAQKYKLPPFIEWQLQNIRVKASFLLKDENNILSTSQYTKAYKALRYFLSAISGENTSLDIELSVLEDVFHNSNNQKVDYIRLQVIGIDKKNELIIAKSNDNQNFDIRAKYNVKGINETFNQTIDRIWIGAQINLLDSTIDKNGNYTPRYIVLEPDYLVDTSSLSECFQNYGKSHLHYFRKKFEHVHNSHYILLGNLANYFLDELVFANDPENVTFDDIFLKAFKQKPFEFSSCNDIKQPEDFRAFMTKAKTQFQNIKRAIAYDFPINKIDRNKCSLEPSFFCEKFGFQGRLDLLQLSNDGDEPHKIVELKSGGLPFPKEDPTKIALNHEVQTAIYRLIIQSVFGVEPRNISASILYSASENRGENLRLAPTYHTLEKEIVNIRNLLVATEHDLYIGENGVVDSLFKKMFDLDNYGKVPEFFRTQIYDLEKIVHNITDTEKKYFYRFITFLSRELYIQKVGDDYIESSSSTASLWNIDFAEKKQSFNVLSDLTITAINESDRDMQIIFDRNDTSDFVNFREGEICVLYPHQKPEDTVLTNQILKGTIAQITAQTIVLKFRYKQKNKDFFHTHSLWAIEHDRLDHTYNAMYKSLFDFLKSPIDKRSIILGLKKPHPVTIQRSKSDDEIIRKQDDVINKAIAATDYFLIVGPPGTGKTSVFARRLIQYYYTHTDKNILLIAYTNRAVDELCEAINQAFGFENQQCTDYIRIGTELSCKEGYRHRLLQNIAHGVKSREELRKTIQHQRIFVGTLAAIIGKPELFDIKQFHIAIIDEASQILEPQIVGLLPKFDKFILIGDHKQLSTITLQDESKSQIIDSKLNIIELYNCRESLFERLFRVCEKNKWEHVYDALTYQGRMHIELADFPNKHFYTNILRPINNWQQETLAYTASLKFEGYNQIVSSKRIAFFDVIGDNQGSDKINHQEAEIAVSLAKCIIEQYRANKLTFDSEKTVGIITPYRNQIALIKHKLNEAGIHELQRIMVDTVERFQGSQRDIIIVSFCINKAYQLDFLSNLNNDKTVDRKLNVALTRARQQLFLIGNKYILAQNLIYRSLLDSIEKI